MANKKVSELTATLGANLVDTDLIMIARPSSTSNLKITWEEFKSLFVNLGDVIDQDDMASNLATKVPTQQSVKAYVDTQIASLDSGVVAVTSNRTILSTDKVLLVDSSAGNVTLAFPAVASSTGRKIIVKKISSDTNAITSDGNSSEQIEGATTHVFYLQYESYTYVCNGTGWYII